MLTCIWFLTRLFEEHVCNTPGVSVKCKVFGSRNIEDCHSFNIYIRVLIFGMDVLSGSNIGVVESNWKNLFSLNFHHGINLFSSGAPLYVHFTSDKQAGV